MPKSVFVLSLFHVPNKLLDSLTMNFHSLFALILFFSIVYLCKSEEECANMDEDGTCLQRCSEGTFVYLPGCDNETMSQRTCREPEARSLGYICDYTRCECHEPKLWDEAAKTCVIVGECSDQAKVIEDEEKLKKEQENATFLPYSESE